MSESIPGRLRAPTGKAQNRHAVAEAGFCHVLLTTAGAQPPERADLTRPHPDRRSRNARFPSGQGKRNSFHPSISMLQTLDRILPSFINENRKEAELDKSQWKPGERAVCPYIGYRKPQAAVRGLRLGRERKRSLYQRSPKVTGSISTVPVPMEDFVDFGESTQM